MLHIEVFIFYRSGNTGLASSVIRCEMAVMPGINVDANCWVFNHRTPVSDLLAETFSLDELKLKTYASQMRKNLGERRRRRNTTCKMIIDIDPYPQPDSHFPEIHCGIILGHSRKC